MTAHNPTVPNAHLSELIPIESALTTESASAPSQQERAAAASGADSPSAVEQQEIALRLRHAHLSETLPELKAAEKRAIEDRRVAEAEQAQIVRLLKAHERIKHPRRLAK